MAQFLAAIDKYAPEQRNAYLDGGEVKGLATLEASCCLLLFRLESQSDSLADALDGDRLALLWGNYCRLRWL